MNNLHKHLAPVSSAAWTEIEDEATRTIRRHLAGRRVVDTSEPKGTAFAGVGSGRGTRIAAPHEGIQALRREVLPLVELRVPFTLSREEIDAVERGSCDSDWQPVKDAARKIAFAEDRAVFDGYAAAGIRGLRQGSSNPHLSLPASARDLSARPCRCTQYAASGRGQWPLFRRTGGAGLSCPERGRRGWLSCPQACRKPDRRQHHLGTRH